MGGVRCWFLALRNASCRIVLIFIYVIKLIHNGFLCDSRLLQYATHASKM